MSLEFQQSLTGEQKKLKLKILLQESIVTMDELSFEQAFDSIQDVLQRFDRIHTCFNPEDENLKSYVTFNEEFFRSK
jgi:hypothetical protein